MKTFRRIVAMAVIVGLGLPALACTAQPPPASPTGQPSAPASPSPSPSPRELAEAAAIDAYNNMWQTFASAGTAQNPDEPLLRQYATGDALARVVATLAAYRHADLIMRGAPITNPSVESATPAEDPTEVRLVDCADSTGWTTHHRDTGEQVTPDPRGRRKFTAVVVLTDGIWKVSRYDFWEIGSC